MQDLNVALDRLRSGEPIESVLTPAAPVASHVLDDDMDSDDDVEDDVAAELSLSPLSASRARTKSSWGKYVHR